MKPLAYEIEAKLDTENFAIKLNATRDQLFKRGGSRNSVALASQTKQKNDLKEWRKNIVLLRERLELGNAI